MHEGEPEQSQESVPALDVRERMEVVYLTHGFIPHTKDELNEIVSIDSFAVKKGGVALHLNEVLLHQKKAQTADPTQAVKSKTQEYTWFATQAHQDGGDLLLLHHRSRDMLNPKVSLYDYLQDLKVDLHSDDPAYDVGVRQLVRHIDLNNLRVSGTSPSQLGDILKKRSRIRGEKGSRKITDMYDFAVDDDDMWAYVDSRIQAITIGELRNVGVLEDAIDASINRFDYWIEVLKASRFHMLARPIASRALTALTEHEREKS